jgi:hypothetical protein
LTHKSFVFKFYAESFFKHNSQISLMFSKNLVIIRIIWLLCNKVRIIRRIMWCMVWLYILWLLQITIVWHCTVWKTWTLGAHGYALYVIAITYGGTQ